MGYWAVEAVVSRCEWIHHHQNHTPRNHQRMAAKQREEVTAVWCLGQQASLFDRNESLQKQREQHEHHEQKDAFR